MTKAKILVVEDKFIVAEDIAASLRKLGYEVPETLMSGEEAIEQAQSLRPDLVLMDIHLKGQIDGIEAARQLKEKFALPVIYLTAHSDDSTLQRASQTEPLGYLLKPFEERQLYTSIELALNHQRAKKQNQIESTIHNIYPARDASSAVRARKEFMHIIGNHPALLELLEKAELVAKTDVTVHIFGENGTGKELIADAIHKISTRRDKHFIKINCSAIPTALLESALFGHVKGSFTGATRDQQGFIEHVEGGTLFLDEIGDISPEIQVKLLRLLQSREYARVGDTTIRQANVRIITATNRDLKELVKEKKLREDFFYRIHVFPLIVPALRDRTSDIVLLAEHFRHVFNNTFDKKISGFSAEALQVLNNHSWPGNIRELENAIRHAFVVVPDGSIIDKQHLPPDVLGSYDQVLVAPKRENVVAIANQPRESQNEREIIFNALTATRGNKTKAAKLLGYSRVTLWKKMSRLGIEDKEESNSSLSVNC